MTSIKFIIEEVEHEFDLARVMSSEAIALEEDWGVSLIDLETQLTSGRPSMRIVTAVVWLMQVRALAASEHLAFALAAKRMPAATYDVNLMAIRQGPGEPENPTDAGTPTPGTRTTPGTSARKRARKPAPVDGSATSATSPTT